MGTIDDKGIVDSIMKGGGWMEGSDHDRPDNPPAIRIVEYTNMVGKRTWGVVFSIDLDIDRYNRPSEYIQDPVTIWEKMPAKSVH